MGIITTEQIAEYMERMIAEDFLAGNTARIHRIQIAAGVIMDAAESFGDKDGTYKFRVVAAHAANKQEEIERIG
ncbi:MAG: hypothetical protein HC837_19260 [Chloroflexaceae bacterium]|nr:hypothetical protein [Chloroflexaceae bacterium]